MDRKAAFGYGAVGSADEVVAGQEEVVVGKDEGNEKRDKIVRLVFSVTLDRV